MFSSNIDTDKWTEIFSTIRRHKLRSFLTASGVAWGIYILVILLGSGNGLQNGVNHLLSDEATNSVWVSSGTTSLPFAGMQVGRKIEFQNEDIEAIIRNPEVEYFSGRFFLPGQKIVKYNNQVKDYDIMCVHPGHQHLKGSEIVEGRFINELDIQNFRKTACVGTQVAEELFPNESSIGRYVNIDNVDYKIIGVFEDEGDYEEETTIYLPITTAQKIYGGTARVDKIIFTTGQSSPRAVRKLVKNVKKQLAAKYHFSKKDRQAIHISNDLESFQQYQDLFSTIKFFVWLVGIGCIMAGAIGVSNIMLITVKERTKEIGIRRALGATRRSILGLILTEAAFITASAGYVGLLLGVGTIYTAQRILEFYKIETDFFRQPEVDPTTAIGAIIVLIIFGILAGLFPALKAVKVPPVVAIRQ